MDVLKEFPEKNTLINWNPQQNNDKIREVNGHIHTPYSFSAFGDMSEPFEMATNEGVDVLGINDFFVTAGYKEFSEKALQYKIFPLFNIEFIGLMEKAREQELRVNDPKNPGRMYLSGKGLDYPVTLSGNSYEQLNYIRQKSQEQVQEMIRKADEWLRSHSEFGLSYEEVKHDYAKELVRERHIAQAIRKKMESRYPDNADKKAFLEKIYDGRPSQVDLNDFVRVENEIRDNLLKKGGKAFVPEDPEAYLNMDQLIDIILNGGGIPCYPVLLDDPNGNYTDVEGDWEFLITELKAKGVGCIELIPGRNDFSILKDFVRYCEANNFVVLFGTEHNTPKRSPITVTARNNTALDEELRRVSWNGACVVAAHQYLRSKGEEGFTDANGEPKSADIEYFTELGKAVIEKYMSQV